MQCFQLLDPQEKKVVIVLSSARDAGLYLVSNSSLLLSAVSAFVFVCGMLCYVINALFCVHLTLSLSV